MKTELTNIKHNGIWWVAVLTDGNCEFTLNPENLKIRIENLKGQGIDSSTEEAALAEIKSREKSGGI